MKILSNPIIEELSGYLKCLSRLSEYRSVFGVVAYEVESDIDIFINEVIEFWNKGDEYSGPREYSYSGRSIIKYESIVEQIEQFVFSGFLSRSRINNESAKKYITRTLIEDINEQYGLLSISIKEDGVFHPLISSEVFRLDIKSPTEDRSLYFLVKIENVYVLTYFSKYKTDKK